MKPKGYLVFHLNIAFSSIEEEAWTDVIQTCYHPLLDLIEKTSIPIGIELTGWTLKQIERIDIAWIKRFKSLLNTGSCELIGSGYCQIIGPLVPYKVNEWNQKLGIESYKKILDCRPEIALVNEMAFSSSLVDLYDQFDYKGFIMDRDNIKLALDSDKVPSHAKGVGDSVMPVLWSDSILFQKVQYFAHGDISINNYLDYIQSRIDDGELLFPIYFSDAEVFDYRPGRFSEERPTHPEGEWYRVEKMLNSLSTHVGMEWVSPSQALEFNHKAVSRNVSQLTSIAYPVPVKKQAKYNISRWAVTGRDDLWMNSMCHRITQHLTKSNNNNSSDWRQICELWSSDLRTHITDKKWAKATNQLSAMLNSHNITSDFGINHMMNDKYDSLKDVIGHYGGAEITLHKDNIFLSISTNNIQIELNLRRGLSINSLAFASQGMEPCIGTLPHGYFSSISLGSDYYSGGLIVELPLQRRRITDLEPVTPCFLLTSNGDIEIHAEIITPLGIINKIIRISVNNEDILLSYSFPNWDNIIGSVRLGNITFLNKFNSRGVSVLTSNGGVTDDCFLLKGEVKHTASSSTLVSSSSGFGATNGDICIKSNHGKVYLNWDPAECAVMPMLQYLPSKPSSLFRVFFSLKEIDDTAKESKIGSFSYNISSFKKKYSY
jgi:hypothetical protein